MSWCQKSPYFCTFHTVTRVWLRHVEEVGDLRHRDEVFSGPDVFAERVSALSLHSFLALLVKPQVATLHAFLKFGLLYLSLCACRCKALDWDHRSRVSNLLLVTEKNDSHLFGNSFVCRRPGSTFSPGPLPIHNTPTRPTDPPTRRALRHRREQTVFEDDAVSRSLKISLLVSCTCCQQTCVSILRDQIVSERGGEGREGSGSGRWWGKVTEDESARDEQLSACAA